MVGKRPKKLIEPEYHDYFEMDYFREQAIHVHTMYAEQNDLIEKQIRSDAFLLRQL